MPTSRVTAPLTYYVSLSLPVIAWIGIEAGYAMSALGMAFAFIGLPVFDLIVGKDHRSPNQADVIALDDVISYRVILYIYAVVQTLLLWRMCHIWNAASWQWWQYALSIGSIGAVTGGLGITIAHELGHRNAAWERYIGYILLGQVSYVHFALEHVAGHHRNVGLRHDPATARKGETVYAFIVRCIVQSWLHVWQMEARRLRNCGRLPYGVRNRMWWWSMIPVAMAAGVGSVYGSSVAMLFLGQGAFAFVLLEAVNYVEHYGLTRNEIRPGVFEKFGPEHAWEARFAASNVFLFKLQRHADHHLLPQRRYQSLRVHEESPQLPQGYPAMVLLSLIPPLWRRVIHPRMPRVPAPLH